jgi:PQQ-like domain
MNMTRCGRRIGRASALGTVILAAVVTGHAAQLGGGTGMVKLGRDVLISPERDMTYLPDPEGGIRAVELVTGKTRWVNRRANWPLTLSGSGDRLIGLSHAAANRPDKVLNLVAIERKSGGVLWQRAVPLLEQARPISAAPSANPFAVTALPAEGGEAIVSFNISPTTPRRGLRPGADEPLPLPNSGRRAAPAVDGPQSAARGAIRLDANGNATPLPPEQHPAAAPVISKGPPRGGDEIRLPSADGRHFMIVDARGMDLLAPMLKLQFHDDETGKLIGTVHTASVPEAYVVMEGQVVLLTVAPAVVGKEKYPSPRKLLALDLGSGKEKWSVPVRTDPYESRTPP